MEKGRNNGNGPKNVPKIVLNVPLHVSSTFQATLRSLRTNDSVKQICIECKNIQTAMFEY